MKHTFKILLVALIVGLLCAYSTQAQNVVRKGNMFEQVNKKTEPIKTCYVYQDKDGIQYPIYLSSKGKAFIIKKSKKTGKEYRQYLPEITKQLSK